MNYLPMGYFTANTLAGEARRRGVQILPVDINASGDKCVAVVEESVEVWRCGSMEETAPSPHLHAFKLAFGASGSHGPRGNPSPDAPRPLHELLDREETFTVS